MFAVYGSVGYFAISSVRAHQLQTEEVARQGGLASSTSITPAPTVAPTATPTNPPVKVVKKSITGAPTVGAPPQNPSRFGISVGDTLMGLSAAQLAQRLDDFKAIGVGWVRLDLDWNNIQPNSASSYTWDRFDGIVTAASARGLNLLPIIDNTPKWARRSECNSEPTCAPANNAQFATYAREAVRRYSPRGIHQWEIWNEENSHSSWLPNSNAGDYVGLLKAVYPQIKQADPNATVILGGLASTDYDDGGVPQIDYLNSVYASGGGAFFDAVAYHPYSYPVPPSYVVAWSAWTKMGTTPTSLRSVMIAHGDSAKKIWVTEYGAPTNGPGGIATTTNYNLDGSPDHVNEALQAAMASDMVRSVNATPWIAVSFWYGYKDDGTDAGDTENFYGLIRADGSRKPSYDAYRGALGH